MTRFGEGHPGEKERPRGVRGPSWGLNLGPTLKYRLALDLYNLIPDMSTPKLQCPRPKFGPKPSL